jgi:hypothetical protein
MEVVVERGAGKLGEQRKAQARPDWNNPGGPEDRRGVDGGARADHNFQSAGASLREISGEFLSPLSGGIRRAPDWSQQVGVRFKAKLFVYGAARVGLATY